MSYQKVKSARYDAETKELVTIEKCNNDTAPYREIRRPFASVADIYRVITWVADGCLQMRKWSKEFTQLFAEYPNLITTDEEWNMYHKIGYDEMMKIQQGKERRARHQCVQIVARFKQLAKIA